MIETELKHLIIPTSSHIPAIGNRLYIAGFPTSSVTYPMAVMYSISRIAEEHGDNLFTDRLQFSIYADYLSSASDIAEAIKTKLKRFVGSPSTLSTTYVVINSIFDNMSYMYDDRVLKHVKIMDMIIRYRST